MDLAELVSGVTTFRGNYVLTGAEGYIDSGYDRPAVWLSGDGTTWRRAAIDAEPLTVGFGAPIVVGDRILSWSDGSIWTSDSGDLWQREDNASLDGGMVLTLVGAGGNAVAFGRATSAWDSLPKAWISADGIDWTPLEGDDIAHIGRGFVDAYTDGPVAYAFVAANEQIYDQRKIDAIEVWRSTDGSNWANLGQLEGSHGISLIDGVATNDDGVVVVSMYERITWYSHDGHTWKQADQPPLRGISPEVVAVAATDQAFVMTSGRYPRSGTGIFNEDNVTGLTWTSPDGNTWTEQQDSGWDGLEIDLMFTTGSTLVGVGREFTDVPSGAIWAAPFPNPQ